jgi:formate hydrogenlyase subunit 4
MDNRENMNVAATESTSGMSWVNVLLGIWVIISPFVVQFTHQTAAMWNNVIIGIIIALLALIRTSTPRQIGWSWANVILGIWMIISPFALGTMTTAILWNNIILGIVIAIIASANASIRTHATA